MTSEPLQRHRGSGRVPLAATSLAGAGYVAAWIIGLAIWPSNVAITASGREVVDLYGAHRGVAVVQYVLVEGVAAIALAIVLVAAARAADGAGAVSASRVVLIAGLTACLVSLAECVLGVVLATSLASPAHAHDAGAVFDAINRLDGVKMLALAITIAAATLARRRLGLPPWLIATGGLASLALTVSGVGYLALDGTLSHATYASLPLLLVWVSGTAVVLARRQATDRAPGDDGTHRAARPTTAVALEGVVKSYRGPDGPVRAVRGIDVAIERGETLALLGPNGAGKSTTLDMLLGLTKPDSGAVSIFGTRPHEAIAAGQVGAMLQTGALIHDLSVRELIAMMAALYPEPLGVGDVLEVTGLSGLANQRTQRLSGGQMQRVRLALALVSDPELLVLDEPTVALDVEARRDFWATMRSFAAGGKTVIFATHYLEEADAYADRVVLMAHGEVVADGPTSVIKAMVGTRTIRATLPEADDELLGGLPGVTSAERHGETVILTCSDSDTAIRALLDRYADAEDIEITGAGLEQAFLTLTSDRAVDVEVLA